MDSLLITLTCCLWIFVKGVLTAQQAFRVQPDNVTVVQGSTAILRCEVEHASGIVQWVKDGLLLGPDRNIPGFPRYSMTGDPQKGDYNLRIERCELSDDTEYHCQVGRSEVSQGIISITALLNVLIPPQAPQFLEHVSGSTVTWVFGVEYPVGCRTQDAKPAATITITKSGVEVLAESSNSPGSKDRLENTEISAKVIPQGSDNGKLLTCSAQNPALAAPLSVSFTMNVLFPPNVPVIEGYTGPTVKSETTLNLVCVSQSGNPLATLQWLKNEEVLSTRWDSDVRTQSSRSPLSLTIKPEDNMAVVSCEAINHVTPMALRASITLNVLFPPTDVTILGSTSVKENASLSLSCYTTPSNPPAQIRWWLGSKELPETVVAVNDGAFGGKVTMSNITELAYKAQDGMQLTCEAFNEAIPKTISKMITLSVQHPPEKLWIDAPPSDKRFRAGATVKLTCYCSGGNPKPQLTWTKDNSNVRDAVVVPSGKIVSKEITIVTAPNDNQAAYRCDVRYDSKVVLKEVTKLHVQFPPIDVKITSNAKEFKRRSTITLTCVTGSSNPRATISWMKDGQQLKAQDLGTKSSLYGGMSTSSRITFTALSIDHEKRIACEAYSSILGEGVNTFYKLNILFPPEFPDDKPKVVQAVEHGAALIPVNVRANPAVTTYTWSRGGRKLTGEGAYRHHLQGAGNLEIWNVSRADSGEYNVTCENKEGNSSTLMWLDVLYAPSIRSITDPTEVDLGETAEIVCTADANPVTDTMFQWKWLGDDERTLSDKEHQVSGLTGRLIIHQANRSDAGRYECMVDNGIPPPIKAVARLIVRFKPEIQKGVHLSKVAVSGDGKNAVGLVCKAEGIPNVAFSWAKNGVTLDYKNPRYSEKTLHETWIHTSTLVIVNVSAVHDYALFTCTATNALGVDSFTIQLVSTSRPDPPFGLRVLSFTHNSVTLGWSAGFDGGEKQQFRVRYRWPGAGSFMYVDVFPPEAPVFTITGLSGNTTYNFSVNAVNVLGDSDYADSGAIISVTTQDDHRVVILTAPPPVALPEAPSLLPMLIVAVCVGAAALLMSNVGLVCCLVKKYRQKKQKGDEEKKEEGAAQSTLNEYGDRELINTHAKKTLLIDSGSETGSSMYQESTSDSGLYYYPERDYWPTLPPHYETAEPEDAGGHTWPDGGYEGWIASSDAHEYEEVGQDYPQVPRSKWAFGATASQREGMPRAEYQGPSRIYDEPDIARAAVYETQYGGAGHLV
ncbi:nephrin [Pelobates cultripes]|uniref:Nephrin n=1 Tax=Pelobates cultripes TaxID=61616 RepID=A0AAD1T2Y4_PELCU|nr:nephrin [Pelobates cultripes]